jgi:hypothetical protein
MTAARHAVLAAFLPSAACAAASKNLRVARRMDNILPCRKHSQ